MKDKIAEVFIAAIKKEDQYAVKLMRNLLKKYGAKNVAEVPDDRLQDFFNDTKEIFKEIFKEIVYEKINF